MTTVTRNPFEERELIQKPFITDIDGKPAMPPEDYWEFWRNEMPAFKMGTPQRPKSWRIGFNGPPGGGKSCSMAYTCAEQALLRGIPGKDYSRILFHPCAD